VLERGRWLLLADGGGLGEALATQLTAAGQEALIAHVGSGFSARGSRSFAVRPGVADDMRELLDRVLEGDTPLLGVVHLWNLDAPRSIESAEALEAAQVAGCFSVVQLVQDLVRRQLERPPRIHVVTQGAQVGRRSLSVAQAPVWGLSRVIAEEHPECWGGSIDLDPDDDTHHGAAALAAEILGPAGEDGVAFQGGERLVLRLRQFEPELHETVTCRPDGTYLVTGGLGGVGLEAARWLVERGARHLILVGRSELPPRHEWLLPGDEGVRAKTDGIRRLEALGAHVLPVSLDVADAQAVAEFLDKFGREGRPPIRGVLHAAAVAGDVLIPQVDLTNLLSVMRPKVAGGFVLQRALATETLDFMVLFSSLGSLLGQPGQASYAAANAFLDALALEMRRQGRHALAVNWGGWADMGLARTRGARRTIEELDRRGIGSFSADEGLDALGRLLDGGAVQAAVAPVNWGLYGKVSAQTRIPSIARDVVQQLPDDVATPGASVRDVVAAAEPEARGALLEGHLIELLAEVLKLPVARIESHRPMGALGLESLTALELRKRLERSLGLRLSATAMWNYPTVSALAGHLLARIEGVQPAEITPAKKSPARLGDLDALADDDALRALIGGPKDTR
jgi:myxalamid-type polyketide synthase MxaE and MxaD